MHVSELHVYPLKSARGIPLRDMSLDGRGPAGDRRWMLVDAAGAMLSQRQLPRMALIAVATGSPDLVCSAPGMPPLRVAPPLAGSSQRIAAQLWKDEVDVQLAGDAAHAWFSQFLGFPCRLVYQPDDAFRQVNRIYAAQGVGVSLADGFPLLLIAQASLDDLNWRLDTPSKCAVSVPTWSWLAAKPWRKMAGGAFARERWSSRWSSRAPVARFRRWTLKPVNLAKNPCAHWPPIAAAAATSFSAGILSPLRRASSA